MDLSIVVASPCLHLEVILVENKLYRRVVVAQAEVPKVERLVQVVCHELVQFGLSSAMVLKPSP